VEFWILGPLQIWDDGRSVAVRGDKQRALLAILLTRAGEVVSTDRLLDELWGDAPPASGVKALQVRVSQLRKALGRSDVVVTHPHGYLLNVERGQLDLHRFEDRIAEARRDLLAGEPLPAAAAAREALALWRGPPLADLSSESFVAAETRRLQELRIAAVELRIDAELGLGKHAEVIGELEALAAEHPFRERLREQLMLALYRSDRQAEALAVYRGVRTLLVEELGIEPGLRLQELQKAILRHDSELDLSPSEGEAQARSIIVATRDGGALAPLVDVAEALAGAGSQREIVLVGLVPTGQEGRLRELSHRVQKHRASLLARGALARGAALTTDDPGEEVIRVTTDLNADVVLLREEDDTFGRQQGEGAPTSVLLHTPCDVAVLLRGSDHRRLGDKGSVIVPFGGSEHEWAALEFGAWLAQGLQTDLELVGSADSRAHGRDSSRLLASAALVTQRLVGVSVEPILVPPGPEGVIGAAEHARALVMGLSARWQHEGLGSTRSSVAASTRAPVLVVRRGIRPGGLAPAETLTEFTWSLAREAGKPVR